MIELLVVVTIIGILAALLFPVFSAVTNTGRKTQAVSDEHNLLTAIFAYQGDNSNNLPLNPDQIGGATNPPYYDTDYGDPGDDAKYPSYMLMDILRGLTEPRYNSTYQLNPSRSVYYDAQYAKNPKEPRHGILQQNYFDGSYTIKAGSFVDPWGSEYIIWLDANHDRDLNTATRWYYPNYPVGTTPTGSVQIGSMGADGTFGKNGTIAGSDDIIVAQ